MFKYCLFFILSIGSVHVFSQTVIRQETITKPEQPQTVPTEVIGTTPVTVYKAEEFIVLQPGFRSVAGSDFHAYIVNPESYAELTKTLNSGYYQTIDGTLYFKYKEKYQGGTLQCKIYNYKREVVHTANLTKIYGTNFMSIDLRNQPGIVATSEIDSFYTLELLNEKNEKYQLRFKFVLPQN